MNKHNISRREFIGSAVATTAAFTIVPSHVLGGPGKKAPSEKLNIAGIGVGGRGAGDLGSCNSENIVALCDVDWRRAAPTFKKYPQAKKYKDFRVMLDKEGKNIDAVIVATPDPASITDAYATIKVINKRRRRPFKLVVNMAQSESQARDVALSLSLACKRFLGLELDYLGFIPEDPAVNKALRRQVPLVLQYPGSIAARHITAIASKLLNALERLPGSDFFRTLREGMRDEPGAQTGV